MPNLDIVFSGLMSFGWLIILPFNPTSTQANIEGQIVNMRNVRHQYLKRKIKTNTLQVNAIALTPSACVRAVGDPREGPGGPAPPYF